MERNYTKEKMCNQSRQMTSVNGMHQEYSQNVWMQNEKNWDELHRKDDWVHKKGKTSFPKRNR